MAVSPYFDESGNRQLVRSYCLYADVLGYGSKIKDAIAECREEDIFQSFCTDILALIEEIIRVPADELVQDGRIWESKTFSDNFILAYALLNGNRRQEFCFLIGQIIEFQFRAALRGVFFRGGWAVGNLFLDSSAVFGGALLDAVYLEEHEEFPRVVLHEGMKDAVHRQMAECADDSPHVNYLLVDNNGVLFVNYLAEATDLGVEWGRLAEHARIVEKNFDSSVGAVHPKFDWLASYHNFFCGLYDPEGRCPDARVKRLHGDYGIRLLDRTESKYVREMDAKRIARDERLRGLRKKNASE
jgi:hypothetical protein